jgi:hypothetical protein
MIYFNREYLNEVLLKNNAILISKHITYNREMKPKFRCSCGKEEETRTFRDMSTKGAFCHKCVYSRGSDNRNNTVQTIYGVSCVSQIESVKAKRVSTNILRRGVTGPFASSEVREKCKSTCVERYGVEHALQSSNIMEKVKSTRLERYGFEHVLQNPEIMDRQQKNSFQFKDFVMPSGITRIIQGYEPFALKILLRTYSEDQLNTGTANVPRIKYNYNQKNRYHYPDIWIPHENKLIEVKSTQTYQWHKDEVLRKKKACEEQGYIYEIWCFNAKGERIMLN